MLALSAALALPGLALLARHALRVRRARNATRLALRSAEVAFDVRARRTAELRERIEAWCGSASAGSGR